MVAILKIYSKQQQDREEKDNREFVRTYA